MFKNTIYGNDIVYLKIWIKQSTFALSRQRDVMNPKIVKEIEDLIVSRTKLIKKLTDDLQ